MNQIGWNLITGLSELYCVQSSHSCRGVRLQLGLNSNIEHYRYFFRPCFFSEAKKVKERFKVVVVGGGSDRWASPASVCP